jgi:hypothetical protein
MPTALLRASFGGAEALLCSTLAGAEALLCATLAGAEALLCATLIGASLLALASCAEAPQPVGRDFALSPFAGFVLNQTSEAEVQASLGPPIKRTFQSSIAPPTSQLLMPGTPYSVSTLNYLFAPNGLSGGRADHPAKLAILSFFDNRLIAYYETSIIPGQVNTAVDEARLVQLQQGKTTRSQAIALLGTPNAQIVHLTDAEPGTAQIGYFWIRADGGTLLTRELKLDFDRAGKLTVYTLRDTATPGDSPLLPYATPPGVPGDQPGPQPNLDQIPPGDFNHT